MKKTLLLATGLLTFGFAQAQVIEIPDADFKAMLLAASVENGIARDIDQNYIVIDTNGNGEIEMSEADMVYHLLVGNGGIVSVAGVENFTNLETLDCSGNAITSLNVSTMTTLRDLSCTSNQLTTLDVSGLTNLEWLYCSDNLLTSITMEGCTMLHDINCPYNQLTSLDVSGLPNLVSLTCNDNAITELDLSGLALLDYVNCEFNGMETLNLESCTALEVLLCSENQITSLDLSDCQPEIANANYNQLSVLIIKNGHDDSEAFINFGGNPLEYLCVDESEADIYQEIMDFYGYDDAVLGTYCSFTPGGDYNTISGTMRFDADGNGCDDTDMALSLIRVNMSTGSESGATFSNQSGAYNFYTQDGSFTLTPELQNDWFTISPESATINLEVVDNSVTTQDFCITPNGLHPDLEVLMLPIAPAQPGFDAVYEIVYRNNGNQTLSGDVYFSFDDALVDYVSAEPAEDMTSDNVRGWGYTNLMPFESRSIVVTVNVNSPMETPAVNLDDVLAYSVSITPSEGDETPDNNVFLYDEIVIGSFDPNDITCLEGETATPDIIGEFLHYNINFENTGTAPATFIVVKQEINPEQFDINTLQLLSASHDIMVKVEGNLVEYRFDAINLGPLEKGNLVFKIRTLDGLQVGDEVMQKAEIFFDYNWPIVTNEAITSFEVLGVQDFETDQSVKIYPNPTNGIVNITADSNLTSLQLYDLQGRLLQTVLPNNASAVLDMTSRASGVYLLKVTSQKGIKVEKFIKD